MRLEYRALRQNNSDQNWLTIRPAQRNQDTSHGIQKAHAQEKQLSKGKSPGNQVELLKSGLQYI